MNLLYVIYGWFSALDWYLWDGLKPQSTRQSTKQQCSRGQWLMDWINPGWILQVAGILFQTLYPSEFQRWSGVVELSCIILIYIFLIISNCNCIFFYVCVCFLCALDVLFSFIPQWRAQGINAILPDWRPISAIGVERIPPRCEAKRNSARQRAKSILHVLLRIDLI